jgi:hypothetical protein
MAKIEIVENDKKENSETLIVFRYDDFKRCLILIILLFSALLGSFLILIGHWFAILFGVLLVLVQTHSILDILFFKTLIFNDDSIVKEWFYFGKKKIKIEDLKVSVSKRLWTGTIVFSDKNKGYFSNTFMSFETFPIGNEGFRKIREILIEKNIIKGDENGWNY